MAAATAPIRGRQDGRLRRTTAAGQRGQAAIYGLFVITGATAGLFFMFNAGQLSTEKTKLVNTSDAVAYSAGVMNARTLNYEAYANRAMLANTVAIAQLVSLSSWIRYVDQLSDGKDGVDWMKYPAYYPSSMMIETVARNMRDFDDHSGGSSTLESLARASDRIVRSHLMVAQQVAYLGLVPARTRVAEEVARANYRDDGEVVVDPLALSANDIYQFVSRYADGERTRFAEAARTAANKDPFVPRRSWFMPAVRPAGCPYLPDWIHRRGGTDLIGFDEWKALDTMSEWRWKQTKSGACFITEYPVGFGSRDAADNPGSDTDFRRYDHARAVNPVSSMLGLGSSSSAWGYTGLPAFYDLSESALEEDDPRLRFAVRLRRDVAQTRTSEGRGEVRGSGSTNRVAQSLNAFRANPAGGRELVAVAASEAYFDRLDDNVHGKGTGKPREVGSLFNPFWHVRLVSADAEARSAQAMQGALLP